MASIRLVLDDALLELADELAKQRRIDRSALISEALRAHLKKLHYQELERREREAYERQPDDRDEVARWERVADCRSD